MVALVQAVLSRSSVIFSKLAEVSKFLNTMLSQKIKQAFPLHLCRTMHYQSTCQLWHVYAKYF